MKKVKPIKKAKFVKIIILCILFLLFVSGCGISGGETEPTEKDTQTGDGGVKKAAALPEKLKLEDEKEEGKEGEESLEESYYVREYADYENENFPEGDLSVAGCRQYQKRQFILNRISTSREGYKEENVYVECYQENQLAPETRKISFEQEEIKDGSIESFDVWKEGYVFAAARWDQDEEGLKQRRYAVYTDWEGAPVKVLETATETISRTGELPDSYQLYVDEKGNLYEVYLQKILVRDPEGQQIGSLDLSEEKRSAVARVLKEDSGNLLFVVSLGQGQYRFLSLNEQSKWQERGVLDFKQIVDFVGISGGEIYFCDSSDLVAWNADSGSRRKMIPLSKLGYSFGNELVLLGDPEGDFRVRCRNGSSKEDYVMLLSREKGFDPDSISLVSLGVSGKCWDDMVRGCSDFNRKTPGCSVEAQLLQEDTDRNRYLIDLVAGEGSDILFVGEEDMKMLAEAGALADLRTLLSEETLQALYPAVLELGTHEEMLAGLAPEIYAQTMMTRRSFWDSETWTVQDIQKILADRPEIREMLTEGAGSLSGSALLYYLYGYDLENSGLYDRETGESHFKDMEFASVLEMAKKYTMNTVEKDGYEKLKDGECLANEIWIFNFVSFSKTMSQYSGDINLIGAPVSGTMARHTVFAQGYFVVNKKSQKQESIRRFLEYMVGAVNQANIEGGYGNVRKDILDHCVKSNSKGDYFWTMGNGQISPLKLKKDGTPYTQEWEAFLSECRPGWRCQEIWDIVTEESNQFFGGTLDAQTAVERIDSRVTLYLKEQK